MTVEMEFSMCGRFEIHSTLEIIAKLFGIDPLGFDIKPNYNVAPSQDIAIVVREGNKNRLVSCRWGFVCSWSKDMSQAFKMINARAETVAEKPSFREAFQKKRCLVVADGFYEWQKVGATKKPVYIHLRSGKPMGFAGLYNTWTSPEGEKICTSTIITTEANEILYPIHDRMPVITPEDKFETWLGPMERDKDTLKTILKPYPAEDLEIYEISSKVNSVKYNAPDVIEPVIISQ
jgi:putative SOS response-associated peptidase YedK